MLQKSYIDQLNKDQVDKIMNLKDVLGQQANLVLNESYMNLQSIWDMDIKEMLPEDFSTTWEEFSNMRDMVAHNKPICNDLKKDIVNTLVNINKCLDNLLHQIETKMVLLEQQKAKSIKYSIQEDYYSEQAGIEKLPSATDVIEEISANEKILELISMVDDFIDSYKDSITELESYFCQINEEVFMGHSLEEFKNLSIKLYLILQELGYRNDEVKIKLIDVNENGEIILIIIADLLAQFSNVSFDLYTIQKLPFDINSQIFKYKNIFNESIRIETSGYIIPDKGSIDEINISLFINNKEKASGCIIRQYGDYELNDKQGCAMLKVADGLHIDINEITRELAKHFEDTLSKIGNNTNIIEEMLSL